LAAISHVHAEAEKNIRSVALINKN